MLKIGISLFLITILTACTSAEERQAELIKNVEYGGGDLISCRAQVYNDMDYAGLNNIYPQENVMNATPMQLSDNKLPSNDEARLIVRMHNALIPCRQAFLAKIEPVLPKIAYIYKQQWVDNDAVNLRLVEQKISWGQAIKERQRIKTGTNQKLLAAEKRVDNGPNPPISNLSILEPWK